MASNPVLSEPHANSYYVATATGMRDFPKLEDSIDCDVCIIGGGFTGISAALNLAERNYSVVLLEANRVGWGASGRNGGQLGTGLGWSQSEVEEEFGSETANEFWALCEEAKQEVLNRLQRHDLPCAYKPGIIAAACSRSAGEKIHAEVEHLQKKYNYSSVNYISKSEIAEMLGTECYFGGKLDMGAGHIHPLNYVVGLANVAADAGVRIYENSSAKEFTSSSGEVLVETACGAKIKSRTAVIACNAYLGRLSSVLQRMILPFRSFIIATEPLNDNIANKINKVDAAVYESRYNLNYFRLSDDKRLLFGGGGDIFPRNEKEIETGMRRKMLSVYPELANVRIDYAWDGRIALTPSDLPAFGELEKNVYYAIGYAGHGFALANLAGKLLAEAIAGDSERFDVFSRIPHHSFPGAKQWNWTTFSMEKGFYITREQLGIWKDKFFG